MMPQFLTRFLSRGPSVADAARPTSRRTALSLALAGALGLMLVLTMRGRAFAGPKYPGFEGEWLNGDKVCTIHAAERWLVIEKEKGAPPAVATVIGSNHFRVLTGSGGFQEGVVAGVRVQDGHEEMVWYAPDRVTVTGIWRRPGPQQAPTSDRTGHMGPNYGSIPSGCVLDRNSRTRDCSDGNSISWTDRWNQRHRVVLGPGESVTVVFPIAYGGSWIWYDDDKERTGFNEAVTWVEATFSYNDGDLEIRSTGHRSIPATESEFQQLLKFVGDRIKDLKDLIDSGVRNADEALRIAAAAGLLI